MTDYKHDGGPAFPGGGNAAPFQAGMSLRDWFAGQALNGILLGGGAKYGEQNAVQLAYSCADAMLAERAKK